MPERYDRSACANGLLLRNTVIRRMREGWTVDPAFRLPQTVSGKTRVGRAAELSYTKRAYGLYEGGLQLPSHPNGQDADRILGARA